MVKNYKSAKAKLLKQRQICVNLKTEGSTALQPMTYEVPTIKKVKVVKNLNKVFMSCWRYSYADNDGDGC